MAHSMDDRGRRAPVRRALLVAAVSALLAGCGGGDDEDGGSEPAGSGGGAAASGEQLFSQRCGSCHTLAAAGTDGTVGPNLDNLAPDVARVEGAIAEGPGAMPDGLAEGAEAKSIAEYVAGAAGG